MRMPRSACSTSCFRSPTKARRPAGITPEGSIEVGDGDLASRHAREAAQAAARRQSRLIAKSRSKSARNATPMVEVFTPQGMEEMGSTSRTS